MPRSLPGLPGPDTAIVETRGHSSRLVTADLFSLRLSARGEHRTAEYAYEARREAVGVVQRILGELDGLRVDREQLNESTAHQDGATVASWTVTVTGTADEREQLRELMARLAAVEHISLDGPTWRVSPELRAQVRGKLLADAARSARAEAVVLADSLGGVVGRLVYVTSQDPAEGAWIRPVAAMESTRAADALPGRTLELELEPERIELTAAVTTEFEVVTAARNQ